VGGSEGLDNAVGGVELQFGSRVGWFLVGDMEGEAVAVGAQVETHGRNTSGSPLLDGEEEVAVVGAAQVEVGVTPCVKLAASAQGLAGAGAGTAFAGVVDQHNGGGEAALQLAEKGQQGCDLAAGIFVDAMEADKGVEHEQAGTDGGEGIDQTKAVVLQVQSDGDGGDDVDVQGGEFDLGSATDALEASAHDVQGIFCGEEQDGPLVSDGEATETRGAGGDGDCHIQSEK
jgi:hypothetical protein